MPKKETIWDSDENQTLIELQKTQEPLIEMRMVKADERPQANNVLLPTRGFVPRHLITHTFFRADEETVFYHDDLDSGNTRCDDYGCEDCHGEECLCDLCEAEGVNGHS